MNFNIKKIIPVAIFAVALGMSSCVGDLDVTPIDPNLDTKLDTVGLFNKCYAALALKGNNGPGADDTDIDGIDGGTNPFIRQFINTNDMTTDEMICGWADAGIPDFDQNTYDASNPMVNAFFARVTTNISYCNQYLNVASDYDQTMTAEVRFLRAFQYYCLMDAFGNIPFATEMTTPVRMTRQEMYDWIENELLEIEPMLSPAQAKMSSNAGYGRVDQAADWLLLSRLYINAEVYTGTPQWQKAEDYAKKVMDSSYKLNTTGKNGWSAYQMLFMGDNGETSAAYEAVFPILQDGALTASDGASNYLISGTYDAGMMDFDPQIKTDYPSMWGTMKPDSTVSNGISNNGQWAGLRTRPSLIAKFFTSNVPAEKRSYEMTVAAGDDRALFDGKGRVNDNGTTMTDLGAFTNGYATTKFTNLKTDGSSGHSIQYPDMDFFLMRAAEAYMIYGEADARLNGGTTSANGTAAINAIRTRANAAPRTAFNLNDILDEWSREFYFEGHRRPDLIRFGKFGGNSDYIWPWKGGSPSGRNFEAYRNIFAIPSNYVSSTIIQNPGY